MHYSFIFALIFFCFFSTYAAANLVPAVCKHLSKIDQQNVDYDFCVSKLESVRQSSTSTAKQLGVISFNLTISKAEEVLSTINTVLNQSRTDEQHVEHPVIVCSILYKRILDDMKEGVAALKSDDYKTANVTVSAVVKRASMCGNVVEDTRAGLSVVKEKTGDFGKLSAISLGFTKLLRVIN